MVSESSPGKKTQKYKKFNILWHYSEPMVEESSNSNSPNKTLKKQHSNFRHLENPFRLSQNAHNQKNSQMYLQKIEADRQKHSSSVNGGIPIAMMNQVFQPQQFSGFQYIQANYNVQPIHFPQQMHYQAQMLQSENGSNFSGNSKAGGVISTHQNLLNSAAFYQQLQIQQFKAVNMKPQQHN